jgi:hypothetical protein
MNYSIIRRLILALAGLAGWMAAVSQAQTWSIAPSTSVEPYYRPSPAATAKGYSIHTVSILTVNDPGVQDIGGYRMVGIPDGLGAYDNGDGTFTLLMNHELPGGSFAGGNPIVLSVTNPTTGVITLVTNGGATGITRAYGGKGAFVSEWVFNRTNFAAVSGNDLTAPGHLFVWDHTNLMFRPFDPTNDFHMSRFCSADLAPVTAYYNAASGKGTQERIFMNGEEDGGRAQGARAFAHIATGPDRGSSYELPYLGLFPWENSVACPTPQDLTIVMGDEDSGLTDSQLYVYVGMKSATGLDIEKAGLHGGNTYVLRVEIDGIQVTNETNARVLGLTNRATSAPFTLFNEGDISNVSQGELATNSLLNGTSFQRIEDGAWDPTHPNDYYFVTTGAAAGANVNNATRLWRVRFMDLANPAAGGTITMMVEGAVGNGQAANVTNPVMWDNICILADGRILLQEDVGGNNRLGKIWLFNPQTSELTDIATADAKVFQTGGARFRTIDEEASGIIDASQILGPGWVLFDVQAHYTIAGELVEGGQLMALHIAQAPLTAASTTVEPYYKPSVITAAAAGYHVTTYSLLTVGDTNLSDVNGYKMVGIPDGLGAYDNGDGTFTLLMNHELRGGDLPGGNGTESYVTNATNSAIITTNINAAQGIVRAHGGKGAFVSRWIIDTTNLTVISGSDLMKSDGLHVWDTASYSFRPFDPVNDYHLSRLCSANLAPVTAYFNPYTGKGTQERLFLDGEEDGGSFRPGQGGRAFAHIITGSEVGNSYELPYLGKYSWENVVASPFPQDKTVVIGLDDSELTNSQVYVHIGMKSSTGSIIERAGLQPAITYGVRVDDNGIFVPLETNDRVVGSTVHRTKSNFSLYNFGYVTNVSHEELDARSLANLTSFQRVEDGAWDPNRPSDFYFITTGRASGANVTSASRLWRLCFDDIARPEIGGFIELVLDGPAGNGLANSGEQPVMMDNLCFLSDGRIVIQEDPGNNDRLARIWIFNPVTGALTDLAGADSKFFATGGSAFLTRDEESSGIIDMSEILGPGWVLFDTQVHTLLGGELVERGQLNALHFSEVPAFPSLRVALASQTVGIGSSVTLTATPAGTGPFTYQWFVNGQAIAGGTEATLQFYNLPLNQAGAVFTVAITGPEGTVTSGPATIRVNPATPALPSLAMYPGFTITGTVSGQYRIEFANVLGGGTNWQTLTNLTLPSSPYFYLDATGAGKPQRFYRAVVP